jgi:hypothetical protein
MDAANNFCRVTWGGSVHGNVSGARHRLLRREHCTVNNNLYNSVISGYDYA